LFQTCLTGDETEIQSSMVDPWIVPAQTMSSERLLFGNLVASVSLALFQPAQDWKVGRLPPNSGEAPRMNLSLLG
jgi:hypothetical protein